MFHEPQLCERGPHRPLDEHPSEATQAEEESDGEQDVRDEREQHRAPVNLEAVLVWVRQIILQESIRRLSKLAKKFSQDVLAFTSERLQPYQICGLSNLEGMGRISSPLLGSGDITEPFAPTEGNSKHGSSFEGSTNHWN